MSKAVINQATPCANTVCVTVLNDSDKQPTLYIDDTATLAVTLINATGSPIQLPGCTLGIVFNALNVDGTACKIELQNWAFSSSKYSLSLKFSGTEGSWGQGEGNALQFKISGVKSAQTQPVPNGNLQITFGGIKGDNVPGMLKIPLGLINKPVKGNAKLCDFIKLSLDNAGIVYVSPQTKDVLENTLFLNIVNTGTDVLFSGSSAHRGSPKISVSFVYGSTPGSLAPDADKQAPQTGSAWKINGGVKISQGNDWAAPANAGKDQDPVWVFEPSPTNKSLIGVKDAAAIKLSFGPIVSQTQPGTTVMTVHFTGFAKSDNQKYDDEIFTLIIDKQTAPASRGVINLGALNPSGDPNLVWKVRDPKKPSLITLSWNLWFVDHIQIYLPNSANMQPYVKTYGSAQPLVSDSAQLPFQGFEKDYSPTFTLQSYDGDNNRINQQQVTIAVEVDYFQDIDDQLYPLARIGTKLWFARNWNFDAGDGSKYYDDNSSYEDPYGRLYTWDAIHDNIPEGWYFPTVSDWKNLFASFGANGTAAYKALIPGGNTGFDARLGGYGDSSAGQGSWTGNQDDPESQGSPSGYYWTGTVDTQNRDNAFFVKFSGETKSAFENSDSWKKKTNWFACRFVKPIDN